MIPLVPLATAGDVAFWVAAPLMVFCALAFVISRKPVHSAVYMAGLMIGLAVLFAAMDAPFLFVAQIIVYTGAILMMFLFVVMLIGVQSTDSIVETIKGHRVAAILAALGVGALLVLAVGQLADFGEPANLVEANADGNVQGLAALVFHDYVLAFEVAAALLITAAMGAILLTHADELQKKLTQAESAEERRRAYAETGAHPGPRPSSGVFARHNAISVPALLPDGSVAETSLSQTLLDRGIAVDVDQLRAPTDQVRKAIEASRAQAEGDQE